MKTQLETDQQSEEGVEPERPRFSLSRVLLVLSVPGLALAIYFATLLLIDPLSVWWLYASRPSEVSLASLVPPQTLAEIKKELAETQRMLGEKLPVELAQGDRIYPVLRGKKAEVVEVRVYQPTNYGGKERFRLARRLSLDGLDEFFVRSATWKYDEAARRKYRAKGNRFAFQRLVLIPGKSPGQGIWFLAIGKEGKTSYGQVLYYLPTPRPVLGQLVEWVNPTGKLPEWTNFRESAALSVASANPEAFPQLMIDRSTDIEPDFHVFELEQTTSSGEPFQLRRLALNESLGMPKTYNDALILASAGLWSPALEKLQTMKQDLEAKGEPFPTFVQEQYDLINAHAKVAATLADRPLASIGQQTLFQVLDGRWAEALKVAETSEFSLKSIGDMLRQYHPYITARVKAALKVAPSLEAKIWGGLALLPERGLRGAQQWLATQNAFNRDATLLLNRLDTAPLQTKPQQFLGTVTNLGQNPTGDWFEIPPALMAGQAWYAVDIGIIRDASVWKNAPIAEFGERSPLAVWKALGLDREDTITIFVPDSDGLNQSSVLRARTISISSEGRVRLLASGSDLLTDELKAAPTAPLVTGGEPFNLARGTATSLDALAPEVERRIVQTIFQELQTWGQVSLAIEDFQRQLRRWSFQSVDVTGDLQSDIVFEIERNKIDVGDRSYPMIIAFDQNGNLLYSNIPLRAGTRRWIGLLPSAATGQILTENNGTYEVWKLGR